MTFDPYAALPPVQELTLTSTAFGDGDTLPMAQVSAMASPEGGDSTPQLAWSGAPEGTRGYALTCLDPDAPTGSGFWHLAAFGIPASVTELSEGAITLDRIADASLEGAHVLRNDGGVRGFVGAAPPPGHGVHRYMFVVHALDVDALDIDESASPGLLGFQLFGHTLGRGRLTGTFGH